ncbi:hypothetical protein CMI39_03315 [Candidatus Pacearchaeota archaeon]|jgi:hypothetical protein|nr:hypothetical protein [Candidatus Pacearchaeota archaeon]MAH03788.1 hypothetical protein [Candidatus Pacearchaeota archaeon]|tara:strand:- start:28 stop:363 length:336 start_codon:yes stop_codon:yes gene_type:complete
MGLFGFGKKDKIVDLTKKYKKQQEEGSQIQEENKEQTSSGTPFSIFGGTIPKSETQSSDYIDVSETAEDRKKKLAKRFLEISSKLEELSNQIYHLQQRIEVLEKKAGVGGF